MKIQRNAVLAHFLAAFCIALLWPSSVAASAGTAQDPLVIVTSAETFPYQYSDQGEPKGVLIDLWRLWAEKTQTPVRFVVAPWVDTMSMIAKGQADIHAGMAINSERQQYLLFGPQLASVTSNIFLHRSLPELRGIEQLRPYRVAAIRETNHAQLLKKLYPFLSIAEYEAQFDIFDAAIDGEVLAFTGIDRIPSQYPLVQQLERDFPNHKKISYYSASLHPAVRPDDEALLKLIKDGFSLISDEERAIIHRRWFGISDEQAGITVATLPNSPPYMMLNDEGKPSGMIVDIWRLWGQKNGYQINFVTLDRQALAKQIEMQLVDIVATLPTSGIDLNGLETAHQLMSLKVQLYLPDASAANTLIELRDSPIGVISKASYLPQLGSQYPQFKYKYYDNHAALIEATQKGEIVGFFGLSNLTEYLLIQKNQLSQFKRLLEPTFAAEVLAFVGAGNTNLKQRILQGFDAIDINELTRIEQRWILTPQDRFFENLPFFIELNEDEAAWIAANPKVRIGAAKNYPPFEFSDSAGQFSGVNADLLDWLALRTGLHFEVEMFDNWQQLLAAALTHKVDMVAGISETPERRQSLNFSKGYWQTPWALILSNENETVSQLEQFDERTLAVIAGYQVLPWITRNHPKIKLKTFDSTKQALRAVSAGEADGLLDNLSVAVATVTELGLTNLKLSVLHEIKPESSQFGIRNDWPELLGIVNKALKTLPEEEQQKMLAKWLNLTIEQGVSAEKVWRIGLQVGVMVIVAMTLMVMWNRRLNREIKRRRAAEETIRHLARHDDLTGLANRRHFEDQIGLALSQHDRSKQLLAVMFIDLDGFKEVNDKFGHSAGDQVLRDVAQRLQGVVRRSDLLVRFGGDEFVVLATNLHHRQHAAALARKLLQSLKEPFAVAHYEAGLSASIGVAVFPEDGKDSEALLHCADALMYKIKQQGKSGFLLTERHRS